MQYKVAEEFALKIRVYMEAMYYMKPTETSNWAKVPLLLVSGLSCRQLCGCIVTSTLLRCMRTQGCTPRGRHNRRLHASQTVFHAAGTLCKVE